MAVPAPLQKRLGLPLREHRQLVRAGRHPRERTGPRWALLALRFRSRQEADRELLVLQILRNGRASARRHREARRLARVHQGAPAQLDRPFRGL